jgi:hypothetical protein
MFMHRLPRKPRKKISSAQNVFIKAISKSDTIVMLLSPISLNFPVTLSGENNACFIPSFTNATLIIEVVEIKITINTSTIDLVVGL